MKQFLNLIFLFILYSLCSNARPVDWGDNVSYLATRFKVSSSSVLEAYAITTPTLYPFTTLLIPLPSEPDSSITIVHPGRPPSFSPPVSSTRKSKPKTKLYVVVATTGGFVLVVCVVLFSVFLLRKRSASFVEAGEIRKTQWASSEDIHDEIASIEHASKEYRFEEIKEATENFSSKNRIGGSSVYRGLFGKDILAVKKMSVDESKEVNILKEINHFNVIKLQGYCKNEGFFFLVFEYMENGSLREWLEKTVPMEQYQSWGKRIQIALDIANGLQYLHNFTEPCYVHKDINTSNILLNKNARAKIANFRLAKESSEGDDITCTSQVVVGTRGYMAPECVEAGLVSTKMDVCAFGVVLLELITGKDSIIEQGGNEVMLSTVIGSVMAKENDDAEANLSSFVDPKLTGSSGKSCAIELPRISVACLVQEPARDQAWQTLFLAY